MYDFPFCDWTYNKTRCTATLLHSLIPESPPPTKGVATMCYFEDKQNRKYKKNRKTYIQPVHSHGPWLWGGTVLQVPPPYQGALNLCLLPAPPPGSRQFEGQFLSAMESQEGHNPALEWRGKSAKPHGNRTESVRFESRTVEPLNWSWKPMS